MADENKKRDDDGKTDGTKDKQEEAKPEPPDNPKNKIEPRQLWENDESPKPRT